MSTQLRVAAAVAAAFWLSLSPSANAALYLAPNGQGVYDTDQNITWLADANLPATNTFGINPYDPRGGWYPTQAWLAAMNTANYLGVSDWRLPTTLQPDPSCSAQAGGESWGAFCTGSEMGHLAYTELGGVWANSIATIHNDNYNLFHNIQAGTYWSGTLDPNIGQNSWSFNFGFQDEEPTSWSYFRYAWPVAPGNPFNAVPVPSAAFLLPSALAALAVRGKGRKRCQRRSSDRSGVKDRSKK